MRPYMYTCSRARIAGDKADIDADDGYRVRAYRRRLAGSLRMLRIYIEERLAADICITRRLF